MRSRKKTNLDFSDVSKGRALAAREQGPDQKDFEEEANLEAERKAIKIANQHLFLGLREKYGNNIIRFLWLYSSSALILILIDGFKIYGFDIPNAAVVALISGAAVSALGVVGTVAAGLFKPPPE